MIKLAFVFVLTVSSIVRASSAYSNNVAIPMQASPYHETSEIAIQLSSPAVNDSFSNANLFTFRI